MYIILNDVSSSVCVVVVVHVIVIVNIVVVVMDGVLYCIWGYLDVNNHIL